jgi:hypothetical protein
LKSFPKVSGSKGIQVHVPLNTPTSYAITRPLARRVGEDLERERPKQIISRRARSEREGKVFIDWSQNAEHKTTVSAYSVRAKAEQPFVSMPISWTELKSALAKRNIRALMFEPQRAVERVRKVGDLFAPVLSLEQTIHQQILKQMSLPVPQSPKPVVLPATGDAPHSLPRSSGQGGRKLFLAHRAGRRLLGLMEPLRVPVCPFRNLPERRRRGALDDQQMAEGVRVTPHLRCTVEYTEKTERGNIRGHGRFGEMLNGYSLR